MWSLAAVCCAAVVVVACSSGGGPPLVDAAMGTWSCSEPSMASSPRPLSYQVTVKRDHTFRLQFAETPSGSALKGTWSFRDGKVRVEFQGNSAVPGLLVTGASLDAKRLHVESTGKPVPGTTQVGPTDAIVARQGLTKATFRADERDAVTWTCRKR